LPAAQSQSKISCRWVQNTVFTKGLYHFNRRFSGTGRGNRAPSPAGLLGRGEGRVRRWRAPSRASRRGCHVSQIQVLPRKLPPTLFLANLGRPKRRAPRAPGTVLAISILAFEMTAGLGERRPTNRCGGKPAVSAGGKKDRWPRGPPSENTSMAGSAWPRSWSAPCRRRYRRRRAPTPRWDGSRGAHRRAVAAPPQQRKR